MSHRTRLASTHGGHVGHIGHGGPWVLVVDCRVGHVVHGHFGHALALVDWGLGNGHRHSGVPLIVDVGAVVYFVAPLRSKYNEPYPW